MRSFCSVMLCRVDWQSITDVLGHHKRPKISFMQQQKPEITNNGHAKSESWTSQHKAHSATMFGQKVYCEVKINLSRIIYLPNQQTGNN